MKFKLINIINEREISVSPNWKWDGNEGEKVVVRGYDLEKSEVPLQVAREFAKKTLTTALVDKNISLLNPRKLANDVIECDVYANGVNVSEYFIGLGKNTKETRFQAAG
ncbi:hypothetical protein [Flavobacterium sp.]|uniref:hypothetical protein n=1 Tax=Flavobacterium sp. TaxID=239 RepID=UPI0012045764|nr:hypothetical protein [Flavobacterium sp.]RZJ71712.1 MAG: hypothetical protein EOO49_08590 [Flavobacterium sp.]